jgi:hypothetical protein
VLHTSGTPKHLGGILIADEVIDLLLPVLFFWVRRRRLERLLVPSEMPP